ncbi:MAG: hypothetical protein KGP35_06800 [Bacteroidetes bacterium]|nr:hypothetical protein [Bacteroidota bacterium]
MKNHKFQQIRIRINTSGESVRFTVETDKLYAIVKAIHVSLPDSRMLVGTSLGLKINGQEVFDDAHEVRLLTCGNQVAPNKKFFHFEERIEAGGSTVEGRFTDPGNLYKAKYPYDVKVYLWLVNDPQHKR